MAILLDEHTEVMVQGITGREGRLRASLMIAAGTRVVAGVTPGRGGEVFGGNVPVYDTVAAAREQHPGIAASMVCVPSATAKEATLEAIAAGIRLIHLMPERLPHQDTMEIIAHARQAGALVIGPNSPGILSPGKASLGGIGGRIDMLRLAFKPGRIGIVSRSGGNTMTLAYYLMKSGLGVSTAVGVGGDAFIGTSWRPLLELFERDEDTDAVVAYGEIGGTNEEEAAAALGAGAYTKPLIVLVGGVHARAGMRFGHAGAIISAHSGSAQAKIAALRAAGAIVVDHLDEIGPRTAAALAARGAP
ncbi:MAG TPA: CoA-binding protein [Xanthobacteraceae bacterium]